VKLIDELKAYVLRHKETGDVLYRTYMGGLYASKSAASGSLGWGEKRKDYEIVTFGMHEIEAHPLKERKKWNT
jgi:hypothetical protein